VNAVAGRRLALVLPEGLSSAFKNAIVARGRGRVGDGQGARPGRGVDSVALPPTESPHTMPRGKQPLVFGQWTRVGSETAFALGRYGIQLDGAGRGA
jgi:hypothetical protein